MNKSIVRNMFDQMVLEKNITVISQFYDPEFVMYSNGIVHNYESFAADHKKIYETRIAYAIEYDEQTWVVTPEKVAVRMWITTSRPNETPTRIEVMLIAGFRENRIVRLWETTWPDWSGLKAFDAYVPETP